MAEAHLSCSRPLEGFGNILFKVLFVHFVQNADSEMTFRYVLHLAPIHCPLEM